MTTYIYILQCPVTLNVKYVGKTNNVIKRFQSHLASKPNNKSYCNKWISSLLKSGEKPIITVIDETENNWQQLEQYWIEQFRQWGFKLTNITKGGEGAYGSGKWNNRKVFCYTKDGVFIREFESQKECAEYYKTKSFNVKSSIKRVNLFLGKYQLRSIYVPEINPYVKKISYSSTILHNSKSIICTTDGKIFNSITDAAKYYGILKSSISNILSGKSNKIRCRKSFRYYDKNKNIELELIENKNKKTKKSLFLQYKLAIELKVKGFNPPTIGTYDENGKLTMFEYEFERSGGLIAPIFYQVIDWINEKHNIKLIEIPNFIKKNKVKWVWSINSKKTGLLIHKVYFETAEEAILEALNYVK